MLFFFFFRGKNKVIINHLFQFFTRKKKKRIFFKVHVGHRKAAACFVFCNENQKIFPEKKSFENQLLRSVKQKQKETVATTKVNVVLFLALNFQENKEGA